MKALVKRQKSAGLWMEDVPMPSIGPLDALVRVLRTGICGTDLHIYAWDAWAAKTIPTPLTIGHEFVGVVEEVGSRVTGISLGAVVSGESHLVCGRCRRCESGFKHLCPNTKVIGVHVPGAFAEYVAMPVENLWIHETSTALDVAAIFDPFGNAVHTANMFDVRDADVLITGAGPIGIMAAAIAKAQSARKIIVTDVNDYRLELARKVGVDAAVNIRRESLQKTIEEHEIESGFTVGFEMSGTPEAMQEMTTWAAPGCRIAALGLPSGSMHIDWSAAVTKMLTIQGVFGRQMFATWQTMSELLKGGLDIAPVVTHRFSHLAFEEAFATARSGKCGKVVIDWGTA